MRLSRLHIAGFKSFPDRSELGFDDGVTAIVGPNGCGKSNVVDAITWVLGEQSAKSLRGERMEDVIFNGSDIRKPTAAAEVRLQFTQVAQAVAVQAPPVDELLDDQPLITRDVEIGRRLYRSGESEYLIDGVTCRLRDIHDLLMDSGLGVKAYAVIEQGKIGQILSSRPAERRMLIEEAAGVTKYKSRRRAAELKLEAAQQNLTRVDDIIFEVEKQRGALKRQAARARRYKRLREELRKWEQVQFARRYAVLRAEIAVAASRLDEARSREVAAAARLAEVENALEVSRLAFTTAESDSTAVRERAHAKELEIGRHQQQAAFDRQQIGELTRQADAHRAEVVELEARREPAARAIDAQRDAAGRARQALEQTGIRVAEREAEYASCLAAVQSIEQEADRARTALLSASTALSALMQARDHAVSVRDRIAIDRERLDIEARELEAEVARAGRTHDESLRALEEARGVHAQVMAKRADVDGRLARSRADRERDVLALGAMERDLAGTDARLRSLDELEARRSRFGDAARLLLAEGGPSIRQRGAVADQLEVERSYERAVDALLGELLQYVLVDRAEDVSAALAVVTERQAGRCGFVVLEDASRASVQPISESHAQDGAAAGARALGAVVRAVGPHAEVIARLLSPALIVDNFEDARALSRAVPVPVATLAGDVLRGGWLVLGGSRSDARGILETRAEVLTLRAEVAAVRSRVESMRQDLAALDLAIDGDQQTLAGLVAEQHAQEKAIVGFDAQTARTADDRLRASRRLDVVATERARAEDEFASTERRREESLVAIAVREAEQRGAEELLSRVLAEQQSARSAAEAAMRLASDSRTEQAGLTERVSGLDLEVARMEEAARDLDSRCEGRREDIRQIDQRCDELEQAIVTTGRALDEAVLELDALRVTMREMDARLAALRQEVAEGEQTIRGARHALDAVRSDVMQLEVARATATADLTHAEAACLEAVGQSLDAVAENVVRMQVAGELVPPSRRAAETADTDADDDEEDDADARIGAEPGIELAAAAIADPEQATEDVSAGEPADPEPVILVLRKRIEKLGPVNMMAIEQFDELESRHAFLTTQRKDLLDSIAQTGEAIRKIEKTTRERFEEAFHSINLHFEKTFTTLFGGGRAGLVLIDQDNDPESGIDIIAQPPGKRLQNVQLLSGGEKALTAMALMFAVFKHRPSPFCLLDEIDAPLDDANIGRFIDMLQGMQEHTQFILITHNRKTMEIADRLYGVTMEEPGVSKLISIQMN